MEFESLFIESQGQPIVYKGKKLIMLDRIELDSTVVSIEVEILETNSEWKQGIVFQTKGSFGVNRQIIPNKIVLWEDTSPDKVVLSVTSTNRTLQIYNVWETEDGTMHSWHNGSAMSVENYKSYSIYNCNDGHPDDDLNDLIFKIQING